MRIRAYERGDELGFIELDKALEEHPWNRRDLSNWQWKYQGENPAGNSIIFVAEHEGKLIAHFAAIPMRYWVGGEEIIGSHSIAMMVNPDWQNRGLIKFVADKLIEQLVIQQIPFTYGYPNNNAYDLHIKHLGYSDVSMQKLYEKKLDGTESPAREESDTLSFREIAKFGGEIDHLWNKVRSHFQAIVVRDATFLNWRYIARPDVPYYAFGAYDEQELIGYCVLKMYQEGETSRGHFIDLFCEPGKGECGRFLVRNGLRILKEKGAKEVNLWMQGSPFFQGILKEEGFGIVSERPMICRFNVHQEKFRPLLKGEGWYFTMGDTLEIY